MNYRNFEIETFEVGRSLWHARFRRADHKPMLLDGVELEFLNVGIAWPSGEIALEDAQRSIDRMGDRLKNTTNSKTT
jgi:hypothetical protein